MAKVLKVNMKQLIFCFFIILLLILVGCKNSPTAKVTANIKDTERLGECRLAVTLSVIEIGGKTKVCYDNSVLEISLMNSRNNRVEYADVVINGTRGSELVRNVENEGSAAVFKAIVGYDSETVGSIITVEVIPYVEIRGNVLACGSQSLTVEDVDECW